jgi:hypothetical protein
VASRASPECARSESKRWRSWTATEVCPKVSWGASVRSPSVCRPGTLVRQNREQGQREDAMSCIGADTNNSKNNYYLRGGVSPGDYPGCHGRLPTSFRGRLWPTALALAQLSLMLPLVPIPSAHAQCGASVISPDLQAAMARCASWREIYYDPSSGLMREHPRRLAVGII